MKSCFGFGGDCPSKPAQLRWSALATPRLEAALSNEWRTSQPVGLGVLPARLPGRESRRRECPPIDLTDVADTLAPLLANRLGARRYSLVPVSAPGFRTR